MIVNPILEIRNLIKTDRDALESTGLTSLAPVIPLMDDHLKFIDDQLKKLTNPDGIREEA